MSEGSSPRGILSRAPRQMVMCLRANHHTPQGAGAHTNCFHLIGYFPNFSQITQISQIRHIPIDAALGKKICGIRAICERHIIVLFLADFLRPDGSKRPKVERADYADTHITQRIRNYTLHPLYFHWFQQRHYFPYRITCHWPTK